MPDLSAVAEVRTDDEIRALRTRRKSYLDLLAQRAGDFASAPDAVVAPADAAGVDAVLQACTEDGVAVVPFGGDERRRRARGRAPALSRSTSGGWTGCCRSTNAR